MPTCAKLYPAMAYHRLKRRIRYRVRGDLGVPFHQEGGAIKKGDTGYYVVWSTSSLKESGVLILASMLGQNQGNLWQPQEQTGK